MTSLECCEREPPGAEGTPRSIGGAGFQILSHLASLRAKALRLERNASDAEDLLHDTVERALRSWSRFAEHTNLRAWLHTIMQNVFVDWYRARNRVSYTTEEPLSVPAAVDQEPLPAWKQVSLAEVEQLSLTLDGPLGDTLRLVCFHGLSYKVAADRLGITPSTVGTRLFRARLKLRSLIEARGGRASEGADVVPWCPPPNPPTSTTTPSKEPHPESI